MAVTVLGAIRKRSDMSLEEFSNYWKDTHGPLFSSIDFKDRPLRLYKQFHALPAANKAAGINSVPYDGIAEFMADSFDDVVTMWTNEDYLTKVAPDEPNFLQKDKVEAWIGNTLMLWENTERLETLKTKPIRVTGFLKKRSDISFEEFDDRWKKHFNVVFTERTKSLVLRYKQHHLSPELMEGLRHNPDARAVPYDGVADMYFEKIEDYKALKDGEEYTKIFKADEERFLDRDASKAYAGEDVVFIEV